MPLMPFQEADVLFLYRANSALLTNEMGLGKTISLVHTMKLLSEIGKDPFPCLVIAPNSVKKSWTKEFARWYPEVRVQLVYGGAAQRREQLAESADVYVINWEALSLHSRLAGYGSHSLRGCMVCDKPLAASLENAIKRLAVVDAEIAALDGDITEQLQVELDEADKQLKSAKRTTNHATCEKCPRELNNINWRSVIADEAHRSKNPKSKQTRALWAISQDAEYRYGLTGTPIGNKPDELWALLHYVRPLEFPAKSKYVDRYLEVAFNFWGGRDVLGLKESTKKELFKIIDPQLRRMPKLLVLPQLPPITMVERESEMSTKQAKAYQQMANRMFAELEDGQILVAQAAEPKPGSQGNATHMIKAKRLMQFASSYATLTEDGLHALLDEPSNKLDTLEEVLEELEDEPVVVFAESRQLIEMAARRLDKRPKEEKIKYGLVTGRQVAVDRQDTVDSFQAGDLQVVMATMAAGGTGLTMTRAKYMIRLQRSWNAIDNAQARDRIHRIGSEIHDNITIIDLIAPGTVEEGQMDVLAGKYGNLQAIVRDKEIMKQILFGRN